MNPECVLELQSASGKTVSVECLGTVDYRSAHKQMLDYASDRAPEDIDRIWILEHPRVYTQGTACDIATLAPTDIPVIKTDRGGQITYHGPGQIILYPLLHLRNFDLGVKALVEALEQCVINYLLDMNIDADRRDNAPGVYVDEAKIAALGLRIRRGNSYHGLSFNVDMDLAPFSNIDPCGYQGLRVAQLADFNVTKTPRSVGEELAKEFCRLI